MSLGSVCVVGAGGHAKVVISALQARGWEVLAAYDDDPAKLGTLVRGVPVRGRLADLRDEPATRAVAAIGDNAARRGVVERFGRVEWVSVVHPAAWVDPSAKVGPGTVVFAGAVIQAEAAVGAHVIVNTGATIDHECRVGDYAHVAPGALLSGGVRVGQGALLGTGSSFSPRISIGQWARIGVGAVLVADVPDGAVMVARAAVQNPAGKGPTSMGRTS